MKHLTTTIIYSYCYNIVFTNILDGILLIFYVVKNLIFNTNKITINCDAKPN
jgi:hypothetical protein